MLSLKEITHELQFELVHKELNDVVLCWQLVPISKEQKLAMGGKFVRIANPAGGGNKNILGKVFSLPRSPEKKLIPAKVVSVPSTANRTIAPAPANIINQKVVPAKVSV